MYQQQLTRRDRAVTALAVVAIHVVLAFVLINVSPAARQQLPEEVVDLLSITEPPPPVVELQPEDERAKPKREEGEASAKNIESRATPVVQPKPRIPLPVPEPKPATTTPNSGDQNTQGASNMIGPGTGAGGQGTGTGSGGSGSGSGGGGTGGVPARMPVLITPTLTRRDFPEAVTAYWPRSREAIVAVAVRVQLDGRGTNCKINRSSGVPAIDQWTCRLVETRLRFRPATDRNGRPVVAWYGYVQR